MLGAPAHEPVVEDLAVAVVRAVRVEGADEDARVELDHEVSVAHLGKGKRAQRRALAELLGQLVWAGQRLAAVACRPEASAWPHRT